MMDIHVCPILMRTVNFEDEKCTEQCSRKDCPIENMEKKDEEEQD